MLQPAVEVQAHLRDAGELVGVREQRWVLELLGDSQQLVADRSTAREVRAQQVERAQGAQHREAGRRLAGLAGPGQGVADAPLDLLGVATDRDHRACHARLHRDLVPHSLRGGGLQRQHGEEVVTEGHCLVVRAARVVVAPEQLEKIVHPRDVTLAHPVRPGGSQVAVLVAQRREHLGTLVGPQASPPVPCKVGVVLGVRAVERRSQLRLG